MEPREISVLTQSGETQTFVICEDAGEISLLRALRIPAAAEIPAQIEGMPVTIIGESCFAFRMEMQSVTIPDSVREIGNSAFAMCKQLKEIILPDSITEVREYAFRDCRSLKRVRLSPNMKRLRRGVFSFCGLCNPVFEIPEGLEVIESHAFFSGGGFTLHLPDSVREIGIGAFYHLGPEVETRLDYDEGWYLDFPYGETVVLADGTAGSVVGYKVAGHDCLILQTDFDGKDIPCFYPCADGSYTLSVADSQKRMERIAAEIPELQKQFELFENGYI